jgi:hypothetical protein
MVLMIDGASRGSCRFLEAVTTRVSIGVLMSSSSEKSSMLTGSPAVETWTGACTAQDGPEWILADTLANSDFVSNVNPTFLEGKRGTIAARPPPQFDVFQARFKAVYGGEVSYAWTAHAYDASMLLMLAMAIAADPGDSTQVRDALASVVKQDGARPVGPGDWPTALSFIQADGKVDYFGAALAVRPEQQRRAL